MAIDHTIAVDGNLLLVTARGFDESLQDAMLYGLAVLQAGLKHQTPLVLCDERELEYRLDTLDTFKLAEFLAAQAPSIARVAIVTHPGNLPDATFFENVVVNRGLTLRIFKDFAVARAWLNAYTPARA